MIYLNQVDVDFMPCPSHSDQSPKQRFPQINLVLTHLSIFQCKVL